MQTTRLTTASDDTVTVAIAPAAFGHPAWSMSYVVVIETPGTEQTVELELTAAQLQRLLDEAYDRHGMTAQLFTDRTA